MSSQQGASQNPSDKNQESDTTKGTSGSSSHPVLRKRHSPNNPSATTGTHSTGTGGAGSSADSAHFSKLRKVSTASSTVSKVDPNEKGSTSKASEPNPSGSSEKSSSAERKTPKELNYLTDYFPNQSGNESGRLTRSRAKALKGKHSEVGKQGENETKNAQPSSSSQHSAPQSHSKKSNQQQQQQASSSSNTALPDPTAMAPLLTTQVQEAKTHQRATSFLSNLVPRMQHLLNANGAANGELANVGAAIDLGVSYHYGHSHHHHVTTPAILSIVEGLKASNDIRQSEAASELAEILLLGNEESLPNMPIVEIVQSLCSLLQKDHNFELMLTAARCITNMLEALPRALPVIAEAIPLLLQKLKRIEYIDVAEQSLVALEVMSRRNAKNILLAGGIASTISHVDFFSLPSQRLAFSIAANCAIYVSNGEFSHIKDCVPDLTQRLVYVDDKRILESICVFFNRVIENMRQHPERLRQIVGTNYEFLNNVQKLLAIQPSNISSNTYLALMKSLRYICSQCPDAALALVRMDFGNTIRFLLVGTHERVGNYAEEGGEEAAEMKPSVDLTSRPTQQLREIITLIGQLVQNLPRGSKECVSLLHLFPLFVEVGINSTCPQLRHESLDVLTKMCWAVEKEEHLEPIIRNIPLAVYIANMLSSNRNLGVLASSLNLAKILLEKLPRLYIPMFEAEGVFHEIRRLTEPIASPVIDRKTTTTQSVVAEQILESLSNHSGASSSVRVIIPQMLLNQGSSSSSAQNHQQSLQQQQDQVCAEAKIIVDKFAGEKSAHKYNIKDPQRAQKTYEKLSSIAAKFSQQGKDMGIEPLNALKNTLLDVNNGITSFQFSQSGIVPALITYLTDTSHIVPGRKHRLKRFASVFFDITDEKVDIDTVGAGERYQAFAKLVSKVLSTIGAIEQFQVRITNLSGIITSGSGSSLASYSAALLGAGGPAALISTTLRGAQALRFFQTHQIRCNLRRHPNCKSVREWRHGRGSIKVDPFTSVTAIERYLIERGIGIAGQPSSGAGGAQSDVDDDSDDISDEDQDLSFSSTLPNEGRIELYIGDHRLPTDISVLQAIRQYSLPQDEDTMETIPSSIWLTAHTIYYRTPENSGGGGGETSTDPATEKTGAEALPNVKVVAAKEVQQQPNQPPQQGTPTSSVAAAAAGSEEAASNPIRTRSRLHQKLLAVGGGSKATKKGSSSSSHSPHGKDSTVYKTGKAPKRKSPLEHYLPGKLGSTDLSDPSVQCLVLLQTIYGLNTYWWALLDGDDHGGRVQYPPPSHAPILAPSAFHSSKLNSKVNRQLCDFLTVATQQIPKWTIELVKAVPFIFTFSTRRSFMFCTSFGRDRALMHLVNETSNDDQEGAGHEAASRLIPRLERRKVSIKRENLLKDAQQVISQMSTSKAMLEVGFNGEVGTGFGPTLEFYSTLSRALQKHSLRLWDGQAVKCPESDRDGSGDDDYVFGPNGLYPHMSMRALSPKQADQRMKRFEFIGRLLAQTLIDSRMLDLPLAAPIFKWLIGDEESLGVEDFEKLEPTIYRSLRSIVQTPAEEIANLDLYFTYPNEQAMDLVKGGKNMPVNKGNCKQFMELVCYWRLVEGVRPEMEAMRRGFQQIIGRESLRIFSSDEIESLFCGNSDSDERAWSKSALQHAIRPDHGYSYDSQQIRWLIDMLNTYPQAQRRRFLQFCTGSPRLPVGGFRGLSPPLTVPLFRTLTLQNNIFSAQVVKKTASCNSGSEELPSAMTCYNYLKIPPYESYQTFLDRFDVALQHSRSFYLT